jgi:energy-coupling factor transport system ATP-binding protein
MSERGTESLRGGKRESPPAIRVEGLTFAWPERPPVLRECSFARSQGPAVDAAGALTAAASRPYAAAAVRSRSPIPSPWRASWEVRGRLGHVFQNPDQQLFMPTVGADVAFGLGAEPLTLEEIARSGWRGPWSRWACGT